MDSIGVHLNECPQCRGEYQSLLDTKRLLASLAHRASRAEIESLLQSEADNRYTESFSSSFFRGVLRPKPLTATVVLSFAGLWIASASLDSPADGVSPGSGGISAPMSAMMMPGGVRSIVNEVVHNKAFSAVLVPSNPDGLVMPPSSPYPLSGDSVSYRQSLSLTNVVFTATDNQNQNYPSPAAISSYNASVSGGSGVTYGGTSRHSGVHSRSVHGSGYREPDSLR